MSNPTAEDALNKIKNIQNALSIVTQELRRLRRDHDMARTYDVYPFQEGVVQLQHNLQLMEAYYYGFKEGEKKHG